MSASNGIRAREVHTRFLYPFLFDRGKAAAVAARLRELEVLAKGGPLAVWQPVDRPTDWADDAPANRSPEPFTALYDDELLCSVRGFLFPAQGIEGCGYLQASARVVQQWFRNRVAVRHRNAIIFSALLDSPRMEVFLSPYGAGLLSIALCATARQWDSKADGIALEEVKHFNYRLAQLRRPGTVPSLGIPHPWDDPATKARAEDQVPPAPAPDAPLAERLGVAGGTFTLGELIELLLGPVAGSLGFTPAQEQLSAYTVVRFGNAVDFADPLMRERLGPLLAGLAQIEEPAHAGAVPDAPLDIPNHVMNTRQWAAAGAMGAAHLVADQHEPPRGFDEQRVAQYRDKYFVPYLLALLQRLTLQRGVEDAAQTLRGPAHERRDTFRRLHGDLLDFTVAGHYTEVSSRHAVNRFYHMAQQGLGVDRALDIVTRAVQSHEARQITDDLSANVRTVSQVQRKIEWLEIFFVSFYATELANIISELAFSHGYRAASVLTWPILGGLLAAWGLEPWRVHHDRHKPRWAITAGLLLAAILGWLVIGFAFFPHEAGH